MLDMQYFKKSILKNINMYKEYFDNEKIDFLTATFSILAIKNTLWDLRSSFLNDLSEEYILVLDELMNICESYYLEAIHKIKA